VTTTAGNGAHTLTIDTTTNAASATTFSGVIENRTGTGTATVAVIKTGSKTQAFTGANTYTGATTINGGTLSVNSIADGGTASSLGASAATATNLVFGGNNAGLLYTGTGGSTNRDFTLTQTGSNHSFIAVSDSSATLTLTGRPATTNNGNIRFKGSGKVVLAPATPNFGTYTGEMQMQPDAGGALHLKSSGTVTAAFPFMFMNGATLATTSLVSSMTWGANTSGTNILKFDR
jgi:fibronectin-binding autotransporter adhesin